MKVGDYVRTNYGTIFKIENMVEIDLDGTWFKSKVKENSIIKDLPRFMYDEEDEIVNKTSPNIIDLIEVGDYVNGHRVVWKDINAKEIGIKAYCKDERLIKNSNQIKSIVTKEQFKSMEYRIGN